MKGGKKKLAEKKKKVSPLQKEVNDLNETVKYLRESYNTLAERFNTEQRRRCLLIKLLLYVFPGRWLRRTVNLDGEDVSVEHVLRVKIDP